MKYTFAKQILALLIFWLATAAYAFEGLSLAPNLETQALIAKQIAPGTSRAFSFTTQFGKCNSCEAALKTAFAADDTASAYNIFRFDISLFKYTWPKTQNTKGAENWNGHTFGGGIFLNVHYTAIAEIGASPMIVQWIGPIYIGATYEFSWGNYWGSDENGEFDSGTSTRKFTGALNAGGGTMYFMNNHGLGFGLHSGIRQQHIINAGFKEPSNYNRYTGEYEGYKSYNGYYLKDWIFYYGIDLTGYSNSPLLNAAGLKNHGGYLLSFEMGIHTDEKPMSYFAFTLGFYL